MSSRLGRSPHTGGPAKVNVATAPTDIAIARHSGTAVVLNRAPALAVREATPPAATAHRPTALRIAFTPKAQVECALRDLDGHRRMEVTHWHVPFRHVLPSPHGVPSGCCGCLHCPFLQRCA